MNLVYLQRKKIDGPLILDMGVRKVIGGGQHCGYHISKGGQNSTIIMTYGLNNVFTWSHTPPCDAPGDPFYIGSIPKYFFGLFNQTCRSFLANKKKSQFCRFALMVLRASYVIAAATDKKLKEILMYSILHWKVKSLYLLKINSKS